MSPSKKRKPIGAGTPEHAAELLTDLYVRLRRDLQRWAAVTHQTPQPRMGYVGQHLVSVVTGFPGGRSGARGDDLKLPNGNVAEIKCCYRVDQLGQCGDCATVVASIEKVCPNPDCGSQRLIRKDDSKWLLSPKTEQELRELFVPVAYYLVLFEFVDINSGNDIDVRIFEIDPRSLGFSLCLIDYYFNIRAKSKSKAPFNLWPGSPKLCMMKPSEIYWAVIGADDTIDTQIFPGRDSPRLFVFGDLASYSRSDTMSEAAIDAFAAGRGIRFKKDARSGAPIQRRSRKLQQIQKLREMEKWDDGLLADDFARAVYRYRLIDRKKWTSEFAPSL